MGSCAAPSAKGDDKFITTDYLQQCPHGCDAALLVQEEIAPVAIGLVALHFRAVKVQVFLAGTFQHVRHAQRRSGAAKTFVCSSMI
ncbi:hypothetical protein DBZ83_010270 [Salmonella enterica subsp. enterica serovar Brancaster]|nr:hypothetical protein DBZ83_010270 [Salmonella enterica subsp. enterica serovar Brancaster]